MTTHVLDLQGVSKSFGTGLGRTPALRGVSLAVAPKEFVAVMGPSGSGKSTLVHLAAGLEAPDAGTVIVSGYPMPRLVRHRVWAQARRRHIGVVFQRLNLVPSLTVQENVTLPLELDGFSAARAGVAASEALGRTGTADLAERFPHELSGGEQQRVAVARAVVGDRGLVVADEPTGALDAASSEAVVELLAAQAAQGASVLMVTHDSRLAAWADRVVFLRDGAVVDQPIERVHAPTAPAVSTLPERPR